jgi:hypothetical protein
MTAKLLKNRSADKNEMFRQSPSYSYAISTMTQSGLKVKPSTLQVVGGHWQFRLMDIPSGDPAKEQKLMDNTGIKLTDNVFCDFNVIVDVEPIK